MPIKGFFPTGYHLLPAPYVQAYFFLPRQDTHGLISFMIDTGADTTTLSLIDVERLNLSYRRLRRASLTDVQGIAGEQSFYQEEALIMFREENSTTYLFPIDVHIPKKGLLSRDRELQRRLPSILGRDVIDQCGLTINYQQGTIELVPPEGAKRPIPTRRLL
jgi:predicted aspartyl protease